MQGQFEEARSIRRKNRKDGKSQIGEAEKCVDDTVVIKRQIEEIDAAIEFTHKEAEKCTVKLNELKQELGKVLYSSSLGLEEKARMVTDINSKMENCRFIKNQAVAKWIRLTNKKKTLEKSMLKY